MSEAATLETREFQAEVKEVLRLMVHSLYSNKEIFLRELISNASDACDKLRFEALRDDALYEGDPELAIDVTFDEEARTLTVRDTGIGMTRQEVIDHIGTIASSGTRKFLASLAADQKADASLIGQFGVGFYSAFIVAAKVTLTTRRAGESQAVRWESEGEGSFTLETLDEAVPRGTAVTLHLKEDEDEFLSAWRLRSLVRQYSDHIAFPIRMAKEVDDEKEEDGGREREVVNQASALWTRPKAEISDDDYKAFYKHVSSDFNDPLVWAHNRVEGTQAYTTLLYLPEKAPFDLLMGREERRGLKLYVRRVFIMDAAEQLLPQYLRFVRGVVDSDDLPLNVSREILQENRLVGKIRSSVVKRVLDLIEKLSEDGERYAAFWGHFGEVLKEGPVEDAGNRERLLKLMRFRTTATEGDAVASLEDYVSRMKAEQDKIYYLTAESRQAAEGSPHLEVFRKRGIEVLLMSDRVDEWMMGHVREFDGKPFQSIAKGQLDLSKFEDESEKEARKGAEKQAEKIIERIRKALGDRVDDVLVSHRLTDSPACLVLAEHDMAVHMQTLLKQAGHDFGGLSKPKLEINPTHRLITRLEAIDDEATFADWSSLLYEQAWVAEGGQLEDPAAFVRRMNRLLERSA